MATNLRLFYRPNNVHQNLSEFHQVLTSWNDLVRKSLIYEYRHKKEQEIEQIKENHSQLKNEIEQNQKNYEKLIDEAANEISSFVERANLEN